MEKQEQEIIRLMRPVRLTETADGIAADLILGALEDQGIAAYKKPLESGGIMNTYMGFSIYGAEIFVDEEDHEAAKLLLDEIRLIEDDAAEGRDGDENIKADIRTDDMQSVDDESEPGSANTVGKRLFQVLVGLIIAGILLWAIAVLRSLVMMFV